VPTELSVIVMKCLAKVANERYQTGFELADALLEFLAKGASTDDSRLAFYARKTGDGVTAPL
jgi:hypothetical protein